MVRYYFGSSIKIQSFHLFISYFHKIRVAQLCINIFKLHGMPTSIIYDHDPTFTSAIWKEIFKMHGTTLKMSISYHPQTDGQIEIMNKYLPNYFRCFTQDRLEQWSSWLPWYNTTWHASIKMTPFEAVCGLPPLG
jgi:hypothetical protein